MDIDPIEIEKYKEAAFRYCELINENPEEQLFNEWGWLYPRWEEYAKRMVELWLMLDCMKNIES